MKKIALGIVVLLSSMLVTGCTLFQPVKAVNTNTYALDTQFEQVSAGAGSLTLLVNIPIALPGFNTPKMIYIKKLHEIDYFSQNQWIDSPARMLSPLLVQAHEKSGKYRAVVQVRSAAKADLRLDTEVIRMQHEFLAQPSQVRLTIRAQLINLRENIVLATREFDVAEDAPSDDPYGGVIAANRAVKIILQQIADFSAQESTAVKSQKVESSTH